LTLELTSTVPELAARALGVAQKRVLASRGRSTTSLRSSLTRLFHGRKMRDT